MDIGKQIKILREVRDVTGFDLAMRIGIVPSRLSLIENGKVEPRGDELARIKRVLDWPSDAAVEAAVKLLSGEAEPADLCAGERSE